MLAAIFERESTSTSCAPHLNIPRCCNVFPDEVPGESFCLFCHSIASHVAVMSISCSVGAMYDYSWWGFRWTTAHDSRVNPLCTFWGPTRQFSIRYTVNKVRSGKSFSRVMSSCTPVAIARPMLSEQRKKTLGSMYSLVGTHSAVKLCRWQKSMLRGRGGCYKWTMYGIRSHQCMEATPSMACANKCTFCWRLNTNPTATEWKWDVDDPEKLVDGMIAQHKSLVKEACGMPGVQPQAAAEGMTPRHCALSLVGEPIIYPRINEFLHKLHKEGISTFLVNNGQFPDAIATVGQLTQLYLSVDGPTREIMKELDRPVFPDYWERFNRSVQLMSTKKHRTVFRLTMIEDINMGDEHIDKYKAIFETGRPHFVELKMLTPAFSGRKTPLRIKNVPKWERIASFAQKLCDATGDGATYKIACGHKHSGCLLLARKEFFFNDTWHTWIDFEKFNRMVLEASAQTPPIDAMDYLMPTPDWALFGAQDDDGFDPQQERHLTAKRKQFLAAEATAALKAETPE